MKEPMAMFGTSEGDWDEVPLAFAEKMVAEGKWYRCHCCDDGTYDDGLPTFHALKDEYEKYEVKR